MTDILDPLPPKPWICPKCGKVIKRRKDGFFGPTLPIGNKLELKACVKCIKKIMQEAMTKAIAGVFFND